MPVHRLILTTLLVALTMAASPPCAAQTKIRDIRMRTITIHVGKAGLFSSAGHDHWVSAPITSGEISDAGARYVIVAVDAHPLKGKIRYEGQSER